MFALVIGGLVSSPTEGRQADGLYWIILVFALPQALFLILSLCFLVESPLWLARRGEKARERVIKEIKILR